MSKLHLPSFYRRFPRIYAIDKNFGITYLGWRDRNISPTYHDTFEFEEFPEYKGIKNCLTFTFTHYILPIFPFTGSHYLTHDHYRIILPVKEGLALDDVMYTTSTGDTFLFIDIIRERVSHDQTVHVIEAEPSVSKEEIEKLRTDVGTLLIYKHSTALAKKNEAMAIADAQTAALGLMGSAIQVRTYKKMIANMFVKVDEVVEAATRSMGMPIKRMGKMQKSIEALTDLGVDVLQILPDSVGERTAELENYKKHLHALVDLKDPLTVPLKELLVDRTVEVCGLDFVLARIGIIKKGGDVPETGIATVIKEIMKATADEKITEEELEKRIADQIDAAFERRQEKKSKEGESGQTQRTD